MDDTFRIKTAGVWRQTARPAMTDFLLFNEEPLAGYELVLRAGDNEGVFAPHLLAPLAADISGQERAGFFYAVTPEARTILVREAHEVMHGWHSRIHLREGIVLLPHRIIGERATLSVLLRHVSVLVTYPPFSAVYFG